MWPGFHSVFSECNCFFSPYLFSILSFICQFFSNGNDDGMNMWDGCPKKGKRINGNAGRSHGKSSSSDVTFSFRSQRRKQFDYGPTRNRFSSFSFKRKKTKKRRSRALRRRAVQRMWPSDPHQKVKCFTGGFFFSFFFFFSLFSSFPWWAVSSA